MKSKITTMALLVLSMQCFAADPPATQPSPLDPLRAFNQAFAANDPAILAAAYAPGTSDEDDLRSAVESLLKSRAKFLSAYQTRLDPGNKSPIPAAILPREVIPASLLASAQPTFLSDTDAEIDLPTIMHYRVTFIDGHWLLETAASLQSKYPSDTSKALHALTTMFRDTGNAFDDATAQITAGKLIASQDVITFLTARIFKIGQTANAAMPPAVIEFANNSFDQNRSSPGFTAVPDPTVMRLNQPALLLQSAAPKPKDNGNIFRGVDVSPYLGKRVRVTAYLKSENLANWGGLALVSISSTGKWVAFDSLCNQLIDSQTHVALTGDSDWRKVELVTDIPTDAAKFMVGMQLNGGGKIWLDGARIEIVGKDVPTTDDQNMHLYTANFSNYSLAMDADNARDGHPVVCVIPHTPARGAHAWYGCNDRTPAAYLGHHIKLSAWMKCEKNEKAHLSLVAALQGQPDKEIDVDAGQPAFFLSTDWDRYEVTGDLPADAQALTHAVFVWGNGKVWIDDIKVENADGDTTQP